MKSTIPEFTSANKAALLDVCDSLLNSTHYSSFRDLVNVGLTPDQREVILLYYLLEMSEEQVAEVLSISREAVHDRRRNAQKKIKAEATKKP
ncbi:MAG: sigma-70 family RNA polymerase sigma factor [Patescibacteria group bacterium]|nr:sigma-70 family RNA polymerase sigma factor [Patescibacteria group bacterium]